MNQLNRFSRFLASYIDFAIFMNLISIANVLAELVGTGDKELKALIIIVLYSSICMFYIFKDSVFKNASIGKYLVGLKLESTLKEPKSNLTSNLCLRNLFGSIALALYLFYSFAYNALLGKNIVLLTFLVFNLFFFCFKPNKKLGDYLANMQVVEDADNKLWKNINTKEKNGCVAVVTFLLSLPLIGVLAQFLLEMIQIGWHGKYILLTLKGSLIIGLYVLMFYLYHKLVAKFADNVLLRRLMIVCAAIVVLSSFAYSMRRFIIDDLF